MINTKPGRVYLVWNEDEDTPVRRIATAHPAGGWFYEDDDPDENPRRVRRYKHWREATLHIVEED